MNQAEAGGPSQVETHGQACAKALCAVKGEVFVCRTFSTPYFVRD